MKTIKWRFINFGLWVIVFICLGLLFNPKGLLDATIWAVVSMLVSLSITVFLMWLDYRK